MAGEDAVAKTTSQISLLLGETITPDQPVSLRSVHRAALASWARKHAIALSPELIGASAPFTVKELLSMGQVGGSSLPPPSSAPSQSTAAKPMMGSFAGVGIDMEDVSSLPEAKDYREHPFYRDNFTTAEISYCLRQADVASAFCGTWAAKEAILKSGFVGINRDRLDGVEIRRDPDGRPFYNGGALSISHTKSAAVAIFLVSQTALPSPQEPVRPPTSELTANAPNISMPTDTRANRQRSLAPILSACVGLIVGGGVVFFATHF